MSDVNAEEMKPEGVENGNGNENGNGEAHQTGTEAEHMDQSQNHETTGGGGGDHAGAHEQAKEDDRKLFVGELTRSRSSEF
jgi:hypothetical protein